ncbi:MAG: YebG family protein [Desulfobacula sp.]|nr:YebG family protein [Desulfobacula sp.]
MAVIVKFIVVRNGEEKMTFATKKEADEYDKMLDIADNVFEFLENSKVKLDETQLETISLLLAENREKLMLILRGGSLKQKETKTPEPKEAAPKKAKAKKELNEAAG